MVQKGKLTVEYVAHFKATGLIARTEAYVLWTNPAKGPW